MVQKIEYNYNQIWHRIKANKKHICKSQLYRGLLVSFSFLYFRYIYSCTWVLWPFLTHIILIFFMYEVVCFFHLSLHVLFLFFLYTHSSYYLYAIYYFCFTQRCLDEFCLKCFGNTGSQSLLAINSLLAKFFKSFC